ncbi:MAG: glycine cleavage system protein GcvH [Candidatus Heimdallarchaeota archaeon]|nr:glycine cleavage system protein GcvH [Candidatus Heimdallarchaeota archaeon]
MTEKIFVIPCNGLDKSQGVIAREIAFEMVSTKNNFELICPVLFNENPKRYSNKLNSSEIIVIDGCSTRCVTKLISINELKITEKIVVSDEVKKREASIGKSLILNNEDLKLAKEIANEFLSDYQKKRFTADEKEIKREFEKIDYYEFTRDKYHFNVPKEGYYFNENDCWVKPNGKKGLIGISDYLQNKSSDILFVDLPEVGQSFDQFDTIAEFESSKALLDLISPISGKVIAVNKELEDSPDLLNTDPYQHGWLVEIEFTDFEEDCELLMNSDEYFEFMKKKISEEY